MKRSVFYFMLFLAGGSLQGQTITGNATEKPNIVFFLVDDMGWSDIACNGSNFYETPNIDQFAKEGVRFTQAYAACHVCSPTRASIITGEYPARLNLTDWLPGRKNFPFQKLQNVVVNQHLPYNKPTLPAVLKENGYHTAIYGKWHLGDDSLSTWRQGFDIHVPDFNRGWPDRYFPPYNMKGLEAESKDEYLTDRLTTEALKFIDKNKDAPFFLYLSHFGVHDPIQGRPDLVKKYEKKLAAMPKPMGLPFILEGNPDSSVELSRHELNELLNDKPYTGFGNLPNRTVKVKQFQDNVQYAAMVESIDESLGRVLAKLKELGLSDNTIVIFFADNGGMSAANMGNPNRKIPLAAEMKNFSTSNLPLRGAKGWLYEGGIREPLIVKWPQAGQTGKVCDVPVISTDFYPSLLEMAGVAAPTKYPLDGISMTPLLKGKRKIKKRALYWHFPHYSNHGLQSPGGAIRLGDYKLLEYFENNTVQLFNLKKDIGEQHDLSASNPKKVKQLRDMLHKWRESVSARMMPSNPDYKL